MDVFVSHSSDDAGRVSFLADCLEKLEVSVWLASRELQVGDNYAQVIPTALESALAVVVVISPSAVTSEHVKRELNLAVTLHKPILPVAFSDRAVAQEDLPADWRYWLGVVQVVRATTEADAALRIAQGLGRLRPSDETDAPMTVDVARRPASPLSSKTEAQIRSALIQTAAAGGTIKMAADRARRLGASPSDVRTMAENLRIARLLEFEGDPESGTVIRLT